MMFSIIKIIAMHKKQSMTISYDAFKAVSLRSGTIVKVEEFPRLKHLLLMPRQILVLTWACSIPQYRHSWTKI